jgi:hypothetical protein
MSAHGNLIKVQYNNKTYYYVVVGRVTSYSNTLSYDLRKVDKGLTCYVSNDHYGYLLNKYLSQDNAQLDAPIGTQVYNNRGFIVTIVNKNPNFIESSISWKRQSDDTKMKLNIKRNMKKLINLHNSVDRLLQEYKLVASTRDYKSILKDASDLGIRFNSESEIYKEIYSDQT